MKSKFLRVLGFFTFPAIVFFFSLLVLDLAFNFYDLYPLIDMPMHFLGGLSVGYMFVLFLRFFEEEGFIRIKNKFVFVLLVVALVGLIAIFWEFYEFVMVYFFNVNWIMTYEDTLFDLFMGLCGGFVAGVISKI